MQYFWVISIIIIIPQRANVTCSLKFKGRLLRDFAPSTRNEQTVTGVTVCGFLSDVHFSDSSLVHKVTQAFAVPCGAVWRNIVNTIDGLPQWTASICGPSAMSRLDFYSCGACVAVDQSDLLILQPRGAVQRLDTPRIARDGRRGKDYRRRERIPVPLAL